MHAPRSAVQPGLLKQLNQRTVLAALQRHGPSSPAGLSRHTGISQPTITRLIASLAQSHLIEFDASAQGKMGRPSKVVRLARDGAYVLGCVVGRSQCELVAAGLDGDFGPADFKTFPTPDEYPRLVAECVRQARKLIARRKGTVKGMSISVPGLLNRREGRSIVSPNVHQLDGRNLGADLRKRLKIECVVLQECHALCWAEQTFGAARDTPDFAVLDVSEGLGLGVMHGGRIVEGHSGLAGELGHVTVQLDGRTCGCGNRGCLETVATDAALCAAVGARLGRTIEIAEIVAGVKSGRLDCAAELNAVLDYLAVAVAAVINIFNPGKLFIYGRLLDVRADSFDELLARVRRRALPPSLADCQILRATGGKHLGAIAAASYHAGRS